MPLNNPISNSDFIENLETAEDGQVLISNGDGTSTFETLSGDTVIVNDLTTGGTTSALSAEQGKILAGTVEGIETLLAAL